MPPHELAQFGFLIRSEDLHKFGMNARLLNDQFCHCLRLLRGKVANFAFIERSAHFQLM